MRRMRLTSPRGIVLEATEDDIDVYFLKGAGRRGGNLDRLVDLLLASLQCRGWTAEFFTADGTAHGRLRLTPTEAWSFESFGREGIGHLEKDPQGRDILVMPEGAVLDDFAAYGDRVLLRNVAEEMIVKRIWDSDDMLKFLHVSGSLWISLNRHVGVSLDRLRL